MTSKWRWLRWVAGGIIGIVVIAIVGLQIYLRSASAKNLAANTLKDLLGAPVQVEGLSVGLTDVTIQQVRIPDEADPSQPAFVEIGSISANLGLFDLAKGGASPSQVTLTGAHITLRIDEKGQLLTKFPEQKSSDSSISGPMPAITLRDSRLTFVQTGKPTFTIGGIGGDLVSESAKWLAKLTVADPTWGNWTANGSLHPTDGAAITLTTTAPVNVQQKMLDSIPFVPAEVWHEVQLNGNTDAKIDFTLAGKDNRFGYTVNLSPRGTNIIIPSIGLTINDTAGAVSISDAIIKLTDMKGKAADGLVNVGGTLNFRDAPNELRLRVSAQGLKVQQLPPEWHLPPNLSGDLVGETEELVLKLPENAPLETSGSGRGRVENAKLGKIPVKFLEMRLRSSGGRFQFDTGDAPPPPKLPMSSNPPAVTVNPVMLAMLTTMLQNPPPKPQPAPAAQPAVKAPGQPSYLSLNLALEDVAIVELLKELKVTVPFAINGKLTVTVKADIPTDTSDDLKTYRLVGNVTIPELAMEDLRLKNVVARVVFRDGVLTLEPLAAEVPTLPGEAIGKFRGTATLGIAPSGPLTAKLDLDSLPVKQLFGLVPNLAKDADGRVSGKLNLTSPSESLSDPTKWTARAEVTSPNLKALGYSGEAVSILGTLANGKVSIEKISGKVQGTPVVGKAELALTAGYPISAVANVGPADLSRIREIIPAAQLPFPIQGMLTSTISTTGTLSPVALQTRGQATLTAPKIRDFPLDDLRFAWDVSANRVKVTNLQTKFLNGELTGNVDYPLDPKLDGTIGLSFTKFDFSQLKQFIPQTAVVGIDGSANGTLNITLQPTPEGDTDRPIKAKLGLTEGAIRLRNVPVKDLKANGDYTKGKAKFDVTGSAFGGKVKLDGTYPTPPPPKDDSDPTPMGTLSVDRASIALLAERFGGASLKGLAGEISGELPFAFNAENKPIGTGTIRLTDVRWLNNPFLRDARATVRLTSREIRIGDLNASIGEGIIRGTVTIDQTSFDRSRAFLKITQFPLSRFNSLLGVSRTPQLGGNVDLVLVTSLGRIIRGTGTASASRATVYGVPIGDLRAPLRWEYVVNGGRGNFTIRELSSTVATGRVNGFAEISTFPGSGSITKGEIKFANVNIPRLTGGGGDLGLVGVGRATGQLDFDGTNVRSLNDLTGNLRASLSQVQPFQLPILDLIKPFLGRAGAGGFTTAERSEVRATLRAGVWNVRRLALIGSNVKLFMDGTVGLNGRLRLDLVAVVGQQIIPPEILRLAEFIAPATGAVPVVVALRLTRYLSNRTLHLSVSGTVDSPNVRLLPLKTLSDEAVRFFLGEFVPVPGITSPR